MDSMCSCNLQPFGQSSPEQNQKLSNYSQFNLAAVSREQSADIEILTTEGDRVTLSIDSSFEAAYATYDSKARVNGACTEIQGRLDSVNVERQISIEVEGDLNDQEKKEIKKVMREIFKVMKKFLSGQSELPAGNAVKDIELNSLANVEAAFEVKKSTLVFNHTEAEYESSASIPLNATDTEVKPADGLIDRMLEKVETSEVGHHRFLKHFDHRPDRFADGYLAQAPDAWNMRKMVRRIMAAFFHELENIASGSQDSDHRLRRAHEGMVSETGTA